MNKNLLKRLLFALGFLSLLLILLSSYRGPPAEIQLASPQQGMQGSQLTAKGNVAADLEYEIRAKTEGYLDGFHKEAGDSVSNDELLGQIITARTNEYALQITQLENNLHTQRVERKIAAENHQRLKQGEQQGVVSGNEVLKAQQTLELAKTSLRSVERELASVKRLNAEIERAAALNRDLKSITNGTLTEKYVINGEWIEKGTLLGRIVTVDKLKIKAFLLPEDARKLQPGDVVRVSDRNLDMAWTEKVLQISPVINKTGDNNHLQEIIISSDFAPQGLQINTKLDLEFKGEEDNGALTLPLENVFKRNGQYQVLKIDQRKSPGFAAVASQRGLWAGIKHITCGLAPCETHFVRLKTQQVTTGTSNLQSVVIIQGVTGNQSVITPNHLTQKYSIVAAARP